MFSSFIIAVFHHRFVITNPQDVLNAEEPEKILEMAIPALKHEQVTIELGGENRSTRHW